MTSTKPVGYPVKMSLFAPSASLRKVSEHWYETADCDQQALALHLKHYPKKNRKERKSSAFIGPCEKIVLLTADADAFFVWKFQKLRDDEQTGANCGAFRNQSATLSSTLIREAVDIAWQKWPGVRLFTFVDSSKIRSSNPGFCYLCAGWSLCGKSKGGLTILELLPEGYSA